MKQYTRQLFIITGTAWVLLFSPGLLRGMSLKAVVWILVSAFMFWPALLHRWTLWLSVCVLACIGAVDIFHAYFFNSLVDEFFIATALRTTWQETVDFTRVLPVIPLLGAGIWLAVCALLGGLIGRRLFNPAPVFRWWRWSWIPSAACWLALALAYVFGGPLTRFEIQDKTANIYPMHLAWALANQKAIEDGVLYAPALPAFAPDVRQIDTVVVVLGESATAQRWSLLGYKANATNAPLINVSGIVETTALAKYFNTAGALPYMLTGFSSADSIAHKAPSFLDMAKHAGYKVFVYSNSRSSGNGDFFTQVLRRSSDVYRKIGNGGVYDGFLTAPLEDALRDPSARKLIVLHTFGSHEIVSGRYPPEFERFSDPYDNSILYTSDLLTEWIRLLDHHASGTALLLYTSDHGLSMPPCSEDYRHGRSLSALEVPFLAWSNAAARAASPGLLAFDASERHGNALLAEMVVRAVGYGRLLDQPGWPSSLNPEFEGKTWAELQQLDACTLR